MKQDTDYRNLGCLICLIGMTIIVMVSLIANAPSVKSEGAFCDVVGGETSISEGIGISEYDPVNEGWNGVPSSVFEGMPYLTLVGPQGGKYVIFDRPQGGIVVVPFRDLETGSDGWQHNTCGYLITWDP